MLPMNCSIEGFASLKRPANEGETFQQWLERWFLPRPVFDDGLPLEHGDYITKITEHSHDLITANIIAIKLDTCQYAFIDSFGETFAEPIQRPLARPVLIDAKGMPINDSQAALYSDVAELSPDQYVEKYRLNSGDYDNNYFLKIAHLLRRQQHLCGCEVDDGDV